MAGFDFFMVDPASGGEGHIFDKLDILDLFVAGDAQANVADQLLVGQLVATLSQQTVLIPPPGATEFFPPRPG